MISSFYMPVRIISGENCVRENAWQICALGKRAFIATYPSSAKNGALNDVLAALERCSTPYVLFDKCTANPTWKNVEELAAIARAGGCDFVIAVGGGSAIDCAKGVAVLMYNDMRAQDLHGGRYNGIAPLVAIPTTAGTGSEVTFNSVLTSDDGKQKKSFGDERNYPRFAFLDSRYLATVPPYIAKDTAVDALCHCVEGYLSAKPSPIAGVFAREGIRLFSKHYKALLANELTSAANQDLMLAAAYGGLVISQDKTLAPHAMGYMLTCNAGFSHGKATGLVLSAFVQACMPNPRADEILKLLQLSSIEQMYGYIKALIGGVRNFPAQELENYAKQCTPAACAKPNPIELNEAKVLALFKKSLPY